jgi:hypothetical protein
MTSFVSARLRILLVGVLALTLFAVPATAEAGKKKTGDADRDQLPDKWEKKNKLSTKKKDAKLDPDKDGLNNMAEYKSGTKPRKADSDKDRIGDADEDPDRDKVDNANETREKTDPRDKDTDGDRKNDGVEDADRDKLNNAGEDATGNDPLDRDTDGDGTKDGDERNGWIAAFDGTTLVVKLANGEKITGIVDDATMIDCYGEDEDFEALADDEDDFVDEEDGEDVGEDVSEEDVFRVSSTEDEDDDFEDDSGDDSDSDDSADDSGDDSSDDSDDDSSDDSSDDSGDYGDDDSGDEELECGVESLKPGRVVHEASFEFADGATYWTELALID